MNINMSKGETISHKMSTNKNRKKGDIINELIYLEKL